eukprot:gene9619-1823_t
MSKKPNHVIVHPLVLLSVVDHYTRIHADKKNRAVGILLGSVSKGVVDITNSFAAPFEEDPSDPSIWFLDQNFLENMFNMFRKVNAKEVIVGWYSTGPKIRQSDIDVHQTFTKYLTHPVYVVVDVEPKQVGIPTEAYISVEEKEDEKSQPALTFAHIPNEIGALEAEEIGVEHLLRDVKDTTVSDLATSVSARINSLKALHTRLSEIHIYLEKVGKKELPMNHNILYILQDVFNLLPGLQDTETKDAFTVQVNDSMLAMYLSSLTRAIISLHDLVNNKLDLRESELKKETKKVEKKKEEGEKKEEEKLEEKK